MPKATPVAHADDSEGNAEENLAAMGQFLAEQGGQDQEQDRKGQGLKSLLAPQGDQSPEGACGHPLSAPSNCQYRSTLRSVKVASLCAADMVPTVAANGRMCVAAGWWIFSLINHDSTRWSNWYEQER